MDEKLTILVDVDDTLISNHFVPVVNDFLHTHFTEDDFNDVWIDRVVFPNDAERDKFLDYYISVDSYKKVKPKPNAVRVLKGLSKKHNVFLLTNGCHPVRTLEMGRQYTDKWEYLLKNFSFISPENIIFAVKKDMFVADMIIEDRVDNMTGPYKHKLLLTCFHNKNIADETLKKLGITRVDNWQEIKKYVENLF